MGKLLAALQLPGPARLLCTAFWSSVCLRRILGTTGLAIQGRSDACFHGTGAISGFLANGLRTGSGNIAHACGQSLYPATGIGGTGFEGTTRAAGGRGY